MYFGRSLFPDGAKNNEVGIEQAISEWMHDLLLDFETPIDKNVAIHQIVGKGLKIGTYFKLAFDYFSIIQS